MRACDVPGDEIVPIFLSGGEEEEIDSPRQPRRIVQPSPPRR
jgi:hypothetical protein